MKFMSKKYSRILAVVLSTGLGYATSAGGATLIPTFDGRIVDNGADGYDALDETVVMANYVDNGIQRIISRAAMEFDISSLPLGTSVGGAFLTLNQVSRSGGAMDVEFYGYAGDGVFSLSDALQVTTLVGGPIDQGANGLLTLDVTPFINNLLASDQTWAGFTIKLSHEELFLNPDSFFVSSYFKQWVDADSGSPSYATLSIVPVPTAVWLFGSGLIGLIAVAKRRKA